MSNKKHIFCLLLLVALTNTFAVLGAGQNNRESAKAKRTDQKQKTAEKANPHVTINLKRGNPLSGEFIQADTQTIEVEVQNVRQKVNIEDVASIVFDGEQKSSSSSTAFQTPSRDTILAVEAAVKSLRKLSALTAVKPAFQDYQSRLIDVKVDVEDALVKLPSGNLKTEIRLALEAFIDAETIWDQMGDVEVILPAKDQFAAQLMEKYSIPAIEPNADPAKLRLDRDMMLNKIWTSAKNHLDKVSPLLVSFAVGQ